jgi:acetate kinase
MAKGILVINAGSTSVKFAGYRHDGGEELSAAARGQIEGIGSQPHFIVKGASGKPVDAHEWEADDPLTQDGALRFIFTWLKGHLKEITFVAAGHRLVLGGVRHDRPVLIDEAILAELDSLCKIEPSHQPYEIAGIRAVAKVEPNIPQVACFDTSFHRTMPEIAQLYALPRSVIEGNVRHWGYHGISYDYISRQVPKYAPNARRVIAAHLGGGCSLCAMLDGKSVDTSMGFSAIEGPPMSTRCGELDAGILLYLLKSKAYDLEGLEKLLYKHAGLLGLSGISGDMRELLENKSPDAALAIEYFVYHIVKFIGSYATILGGLDTIVFTAGIGENAAPVRAAICAKLGWLGARLDEAANLRNGPRISTDNSTVSVFVIPTNEELMIAQHTLAISKAQGFIQ